MHQVVLVGGGCTGTHRQEAGLVMRAALVQPRRGMPMAASGVAGSGSVDHLPWRRGGLLCKSTCSLRYGSLTAWCIAGVRSRGASTTWAASGARCCSTWSTGTALALLCEVAVSLLDCYTSPTRSMRLVCQRGPEPCAIPIPWVLLASTGLTLGVKFLRPLAAACHGPYRCRNMRVPPRLPGLQP